VGTYLTKAVIFGLNGLLVDTELISFKIYKEILAKYAIYLHLYRPHSYVHLANY